MRNVEFSQSGDILVIKVNMKAQPKESASGKSLVVGSTEGNVSIPGTDLKVGLNVYRGK